jgi:hypothetical protein
VVVLCGKGRPIVVSVGVSGLWMERVAEARDRRRCCASAVEILSARHWWAHRCGDKGGPVVAVGGGV